MNEGGRILLDGEERALLDAILTEHTQPGGRSIEDAIAHAIECIKARREKTSALREPSHVD